MQFLPKFAFLAALAPAATVAAQWTTPPVTGPGLEYRTFWSPTAQATVSYHVSLPTAYDSNPTARFPAIYWLHGSGTPTANIPTLNTWFRNATAQGLIPPVIVVFPNGMGASMWCDSLDGNVPMESVVMDDLIPRVDATYRTIAARHGRVLEGFSMGGHGAGRLGLRRPDLFAGISMLGAGPMQLDFMDAPKGTDVPPSQRAALYEMVWGSDPDYYLAQHPWTIATRRASAHQALRTEIRIGVGAEDFTMPTNADFHGHLVSLGVPHEFTVIPGVGHSLPGTLQALAAAGWDFYNDAFGTPCRQPADVDCSGEVDANDLATLLASWGANDGPADLDGSRTVDATDLAAMLAAWGPVG